MRTNTDDPRHISLTTIPREALTRLWLTTERALLAGNTLPGWKCIAGFRDKLLAEMNRRPAND